MKIDGKKIALLLSVILLHSCSNNIEDESSKGSIEGEGRLQATKNSSFVAERARVLSHTISSEHQESWSDLGTHALIEIETCLKDISQAQAIIDQRFLVKTPLQEHKRFTQTNGCLSWSEMVPYSSLDQEKIYDYPVTIEGLGRYPGVYQLKLAINPWAKSSAAVIDLDHQKITHELSSLNQNLNAVEKISHDQHNIEIKTIKLDLLNRVVDAKAQLEILTYDFEAQLELQSLDVQGSRMTQPLTRGEFKVSLALIEKRRDDQVKLTALSENFISLNDGKMKEQIKFSVVRESYPLHHSQMELSVTLVPQNAPAALSKRSGLLDMDGLRALKNQTLRPSPESFESYVLAASKNDRDLKTDEELSYDESFGFEMTKVSLRWGSLLNVGDHQKDQRTLRANFSVCLKDPLSAQGSRPITDTQFSVVVTDEEGNKDGQSRISTTGPDGCLHSFFTYSYNLFDAPTWVPLTLEVTGLNGEVQGITKKRVIQINPWSKEDFGYDALHESAPEIIGQNKPQITLADIGYTSEGNDLGSFRLNKYLQLSFSKEYQIQVSPKLERAHSTSDQRLVEAITFGNYKMKVALFSPKTADIDYYDIDLDQFDFLSAASKDVSVNVHGDIITQVSLPFYFSDFNKLPYKNIILIKLESLDQSLESEYFVAPFFGKERNVHLKSVKLSPEQAQKLSEPVIVEVMNSGIKDVEKVLTPEQSQLRPLEYYRRELRRTLSEKWKMDGKIIMSTRSELNQMGSFGRNSLDEEDKNQLSISYEDLRTLSTEGGVMPKRLMAKFCRHFYLKPQQRALFGIGPSRSSTVGGEDYLGCMENPAQYLDTKGLTHIEEILSQGTEVNKEGQTTRYGKAKISSQDMGDISHGGGFFAAYGDRAAEVEGEMDSLAFKKGAELFLQAPPPMMMVFNAGVSQAHEIFTQKSEGKMQMTFDRNYRQLGRLSLEYNMIELEFNARVNHCVAVMPLKNVAVAIHVCQDDGRLAKLKEQWYFIARKETQRVGTITDALRIGMNNETQLIRGRYHFNKVWEQYKSDDVAILLKEIAGQEIYKPLVEYKLYENNDLFFKRYSDQNFPGLLTPGIH